MVDKKKLSLQERIDEIYKIVNDGLVSIGAIQKDSNGYSNQWISELFDNYVVVYGDSKYIAYAYSIDADDVVTFGDPVEVEQAWAPVIGKSLKVGSRNSGIDMHRIQTMHDMSVELGAKCDEMEEEEKSIDLENTLVISGSSVKSLGDNKFGGYLVTFSDYKNTDLSGEYFDKNTDFDLEFPGRSSSYYNHGLDVKLGRRKIGVADLKLDDVGIWAEIQLEERDEYEKVIAEMAANGKLGWSSGTAAHLVEKEPVGKAYYIKRWPLGLDASLTPTPCEPRNTVMPLKSLIAVQNEVNTPEGDKGSPDKSDVQADSTKSIKELKMEENEMKALMEEVAKTSAVAAVEEYIKTLPPIEEGTAVTTEERIDKSKPFKSFGEQLKEVALVDTGKIRGSEKLDAIKANGMSEAVSSDGGYLVQTDFSAELLKPIYELGAIASRVDRTTVSAASNGMTFNAVDETSRATGSRYGGVQAYWLAEAGTKTASKPKFRQVELKLKKLIGACYATDELLADAAALQSVISESFRNEFTFMVEDAFFNGDGVGKPLGIMNSGALIPVAKESGQAADTIVAENIMKMWARMAAPMRAGAAWYINQDVEPQLFSLSLAVGTGGIPVYMPANGLAGAPYGTLMGRPVLPVEYAGTVGDLGDIVFANFGAYKAIDKGSMTGESSIHVQFLTDETTFRFVYRVDGQPKWNSAVTPFKGSNTQSPFIALAERA